MFEGMKEIPFGPKLSKSELLRKYRGDVVVRNKFNSKAVVLIEVKYTHATGPEKMGYASAVMENAGVEVEAVDLLKENYPLRFTSIRPHRCRTCIRISLTDRCHRSYIRRERFSKKMFRKWWALTISRKKMRISKVARRWLWVHRTRRILHYVHTALKNEVVECRKCKRFVCLYDYAVLHGNNNLPYVKQPGVYDRVMEYNYHQECTPRCAECNQIKVTGRWCPCEKQRRSKCTDCGGWFLKEHMHRLPTPRGQYAWVCSSCSTPCRGCDRFINSHQAMYGGKCYTCNRRSYNTRTGNNEALGICTECGNGVNPNYDVCYTCKFGEGIDK